MTEAEASVMGVGDSAAEKIRRGFAKKTDCLINVDYVWFMALVFHTEFSFDIFLVIAGKSVPNSITCMNLRTYVLYLFVCPCVCMFSFYAFRSWFKKYVCVCVFTHCSIADCHTRLLSCRTISLVALGDVNLRMIGFMAYALVNPQISSHMHTHTFRQLCVVRIVKGNSVCLFCWERIVVLETPGKPEGLVPRRLRRDTWHLQFTKVTLPYKENDQKRFSRYCHIQVLPVPRRFRKNVWAVPVQCQSSSCPEKIANAARWGLSVNPEIHDCYVPFSRTVVIRGGVVLRVWIYDELLDWCFNDLNVFQSDEETSEIWGYHLRSCALIFPGKGNLGVLSWRQLLPLCAGLFSIVFMHLGKMYRSTSFASILTNTYIDILHMSTNINLCRVHNTFTCLYTFMCTHIFTHTYLYTHVFA